jgi:hypothetical protein
MKVRSWYGLTGEIEVENELWHLVKIGDIALHHPPLVNLAPYPLKTSFDRKRGRKDGKTTTLEPKNGFQKR